MEKQGSGRWKERNLDTKPLRGRTWKQEKVPEENLPREKRRMDEQKQAIQCGGRCARLFLGFLSLLGSSHRKCRGFSQTCGGCSQTSQCQKCCSQLGQEPAGVKRQGEELGLKHKNQADAIWTKGSVLLSCVTVSLLNVLPGVNT